MCRISGEFFRDKAPRARPPRVSDPLPAPPSPLDPLLAPPTFAEKLVHFTLVACRKACWKPKSGTQRIFSSEAASRARRDGEVLRRPEAEVRVWNRVLRTKVWHTCWLSAARPPMRSHTSLVPREGRGGAGRSGR